MRAWESQRELTLFSGLSQTNNISPLRSMQSHAVSCVGLNSGSRRCRDTSQRLPLLKIIISPNKTQRNSQDSRQTVPVQWHGGTFTHTPGLASHVEQPNLTGCAPKGASDSPSPARSLSFSVTILFMERRSLLSFRPRPGLVPIEFAHAPCNAWSLRVHEKGLAGKALQKSGELDGTGRAP